MVPPWWGIPVVLVVGVTVVWFGWWWDRRRTQRARQELREAPASEIPGLSGRRTPTYITEDDLAGLTASVRGDDGLGTTDLPALPGGVPEFCLPSSDGRTSVVQPLVLVVETILDAERLVLPVLEHAARVRRPLVLVAAGFDDGVLGMLRANALTGRLEVLPVALPDVLDLRRAVALTGGRLVAYEDLAMGHLPGRAWGTCQRWISDAESSWVELATDDEPPRVSTDP